MSMVRVMTRPTMRLGFGAISAQGVPYNDTGDGLSLDNFQSECCPDGLITPSCSAFVQANQSRFGGYTPCSSAAQEALTFPNLPGPTGAAVVPAALTPGVIPDSTDPNAVIDQILIASAVADTAQNRAAAAKIVSSLCASQAATCQSSFWSWFVKPSADCTGCSFDFSKPASIALVAGVILLGLALVKGIVK
jgi:hypothetical protein